MKLKKKNSIKKRLKTKQITIKKIRTKFDIKIKKQDSIKNEGRERERNKNGNTCASNIYMCRFTNKSSSRHF
jgi:hypothetical protein